MFTCLCYEIYQYCNNVKLPRFYIVMKSKVTLWCWVPSDLFVYILVVTGYFIWVCISMLSGLS
jgi:Ni,Fe-hydrogenase I cytochrome b subunit